MRIANTTPGAKGSFGIPQDLKEHGDRLMSRGGEDEDERRPGMMEKAQSSFEDSSLQDSIPEEAFEKKAVEEEELVPSPEDNLIRIGITLSDDDYHNIVFRGGLEKEVVVFPALKKTRELRATVRTLKTKEYDAIDELLAEDVRGIAMTNEGYTSRRALWILAFSVVKLDGKILTKPHFTKDDTGKDVVDIKATARERKERILGELSPIIINELISIHAILTTNMDLILRENKTEYLKKLSLPRKA